MVRTVQGVVHGRTIELKEELGMADGLEVEVQVKPVPAVPGRGQGILRTAGALADDLEWDGIMAEVQQARKLERRQLPEEE